MQKINQSTVTAIKKKTPWGHSVRPFEEGLNQEEIKGLFYKAITDKENSVISEINRIVEEGNEQIAQIDVSERIGEISDCSKFPKSQKWIRTGKLIVCRSLSDITSSDTEILDEVTNAELGKNLLLKLTAPQGIIPDDSLTLTVGEKSFSGYELLRNSVQEALDGVYYIFVAVKPISQITELSIKWNAEQKSETLYILYGTSSFENLDIYIKYASNDEGENLSNEWNGTSKYIGFYIGESESQNATDYIWRRFLPDYVEWREESLTISDWSESDHYDISDITVSSSDKIIVSPSPSSINIWAKCGMYCDFENSALVLKYKTKPTETITINFLIGVNK